MNQTIQAWRAEKMRELHEAKAELEAFRRSDRWHVIGFGIVAAAFLGMFGWGLWTAYLS